MRVKNKLLLLFLMAFLFTGCAISYHPLVGLVYTDNKGPLMVTESESGIREGTATSKVIFGICYGDSSILKAAQNGNITKIMAVDTDITTFLGLYVEYTTIVRGK